MKKWVWLSAALLLFLLWGTQASAAPPPEMAPYFALVDREELLGALPERTRRELEALGLDPFALQDDPAASAGEMADYLAERIKDAAREPLSAVSSVFCAVLLAALMEQLGNLSPSGKELSGVFGVVSSLAVCFAMAEPVGQCITETTAALTDCASFMLSFLPVFAGVVTACGQPVTASTAHVFLFWLCQLVSRFSSAVLLPLVGVYFALHLAASVSPALGLSGLASLLKKTVTRGLGLMMTVFVGVLSMSSFVSAGSDGVSVRTARFLIGSFVPVVGGALSEAYTTARGCLQLLKTGLGAYGMAAAGVLFLPVVCRLGVWCFSSGLAAAGAHVLSLQKTGQLLQAISSVLGILLALVLCFMLLLLVSFTLILIVGQGG